MDARAEARRRLVDRLAGEGYLRQPEVREAMLRVPRELFMPGQEDLAYRDAPAGIGQGQTISAPHMVAIMAEALELRQGLRVLEVGTGSGYHAAVAAELVGRTGKVWSVERYPDLAAKARQSLSHAGYGPERVAVVEGDGSEGWPDEAPYDRIYLTCAAPDVPRPLLEQLGPGGRLLAPVGDLREQTLLLVERTEAGTVRRELGGCMFVPLVGKHGFRETRWN